MNRVYFMETEAADRSAAAWKLLQTIIGPLPKVERGKHGKPYFPDHPDLQFSISHTTGAVACAISKHPCGIDIESVQRSVNCRIAKRFYTKREIAYATDSTLFLEVWTRKEALIKRLEGIVRPMQEMETVGNSEIQTQHYDGYLISFCSENPRFLITNVNEQDIL